MNLASEGFQRSTDPIEKFNEKNLRTLGKALQKSQSSRYEIFDARKIPSL